MMINISVFYIVFSFSRYYNIYNKEQCCHSLTFVAHIDDCSASLYVKMDCYESHSFKRCTLFGEKGKGYEIDKKKSKTNEVTSPRPL